VKVLSLNVCGIKQRLNYPEFADFISSYDIIGLTETKTDDSDEINIPGFVTFMRNRHKLSKIRSGGIIIAVKDSTVKHVKILKTDCKFVSWFKLSKSFVNTPDDIIFGVVYTPPEGSRYSSPDCFSDIEQEILNVANKSKYVYLFGDFNARAGKLHDYYTTDDF
jgi:exonuclease III